MSVVDQQQRGMEWRQLIRFPSFDVSECGDVRRTTNHQRLHGFIDSDGYVRYSLTRADGARGAVAAHTLVAEAFVGAKPSPQHEVAHGDGSRLNNHYSNLRWALSAENHADRVAHGTSPIGERNPRAKITEADVLDIRRAYRAIKQPNSGRRVSELDRRYELARATIIRIATGQSWSHVPMPSPDWT